MTVTKVWALVRARDGEFAWVRAICPIGAWTIEAEAWGAGEERAAAFALRKLADRILEEYPREYAIQTAEHRD